ncbi:hypothetical protein QBC39DRAFT_187659 [Podospora conica]|nr:hypothetical protein QBC39DRAFT_187659 [Schizothecium conicum]
MLGSILRGIEPYIRRCNCMELAGRQVGRVGPLLEHVLGPLDHRASMTQYGIGKAGHGKPRSKDTSHAVVAIPLISRPDIMARRCLSRRKGGAPPVVAGLLFPGRIFVAATRGCRPLSALDWQEAMYLDALDVPCSPVHPCRVRLHRDCLIHPRGQQTPRGDATIQACQAQLHGQQCRTVLEEVVSPPPLFCVGSVDQWPGQRIAALGTGVTLMSFDLRPASGAGKGEEMEFLRRSTRRSACCLRVWQPVMPCMYRLLVPAARPTTFQHPCAVRTVSARAVPSSWVDTERSGGLGEMCRMYDGRSWDAPRQSIPHGTGRSDEESGVDGSASRRRAGRRGLTLDH